MKRLFSFIVLAGLLTACQVERIETAYSLEDAVATINVSVIDINTGVTPTEAFTVTANAGTVSSDGTTVTITGNPSIPETEVDITVDYEGKEYPETVTVNPLSAGGVATYSVTVIVGEIVEEETYSVKVTYGDSSSPEYEYKYGNGSYGAQDVGYSYDGIIDWWYLNDTDYLLVVNVEEYTVKTGSEVTSYSIELAEYQTTFETIRDAYKRSSEYPAEAQFTISANCYYNILVTYTLTYTDYTVTLVDSGNNDAGTIGTFTLCTYSTSIEPVEYAYDNSYEHGHGHGYGNNSGGGIIISE